MYKPHITVVRWRVRQFAMVRTTLGPRRPLDNFSSRYGRWSSRHLINLPGIEFLLNNFQNPLFLFPQLLCMEISLIQRNRVNKVLLPLLYIATKYKIIQDQRHYMYFYMTLPADFYRDKQEIFHHSHGLARLSPFSCSRQRTQRQLLQRRP